MPVDAAQDPWRYVIAAAVAILVLLSVRLVMWRSRWTGLTMLLAGAALAVAFARLL